MNRRLFVLRAAAGLAIWPSPKLLAARKGESPASLDTKLRGIVESLPAVAGTTPIPQGYLADRPAIVSFFASWCPPCRDEFVALNTVYSEYRDAGLAIVAINVYEAFDDTDAARMRDFIDTLQPAFPTVVGNAEVRERFGGIDRIPTVIGFDRMGRFFYRFVHVRNAAKRNADVDELRAVAQRLVQR